MILHGEIFSSYENWIRSRERLIFRNKDVLDSYQYFNLKRICSHFAIDYQTAPGLDYLPEPLFKDNAVTLRTSGSKSGTQRPYLFPTRYYSLIEQHHLWRFTHEHQIRHGAVVLLGYSNFDNNAHKLLEIKQRYASLGLNNDQWMWRYNRNITPSIMRDFLETLRVMKPRFLVCQPSQLDLIRYLVGDFEKLPFHLVSTGETLYPSTLEFAKRNFAGVIDKMRCWDGGLSFYTCRAERKHINDELCYVYHGSTGHVLSTDFYNTCTPFIKYANYDRGVIKEGLCDCGVYGRYFDSFEGGHATLVKAGSQFIDGGAIVSEITAFFNSRLHPDLQNTLIEKYGRFRIVSGIIFHVHQRADQSIDFTYQASHLLNEVEESMLKDMVSFVIFRTTANVPEVRINFNPNLWSEGLRGSRNKFQCIESEAL